MRLLEIVCADDSMEWIVRNDRGWNHQIFRDGVTLEVDGTALVGDGAWKFQGSGFS
jgi:hypothetical protein